MRGVYHRAGPPGPASGRPDGRLRPDPVAYCALRAARPSLPQTLEPAAVEIERDAGDVACPFRAQEHDGVGKLGRGAEAAKRILSRRNPPGVVVRLHAELLLQALRIHPPQV